VLLATVLTGLKQLQKRTKYVFIIEEIQPKVAMGKVTFILARVSEYTALAPTNMSTQRVADGPELQ
jgi:hypothetical protein